MTNQSLNLIVIILILKNSIASSNPMCMHTCMWRERERERESYIIKWFLF